MRALRLAACLTLTLAAGSGCSSSGDQPAPTPTATTSATASPTSSTVYVPSGVPSVAGTSSYAYDDGKDATPQPRLTLDEPARASAIETGTKAMQLYSRRNVSAEKWWADLVPLMTQQAAQAYRGTDPKRVPPLKITGTGKLTPASRPLSARVSVPTSLGEYLVILARTEEAPMWRVDRIVPPESMGEV